MDRGKIGLGHSRGESMPGYAILLLLIIIVALVGSALLNVTSGGLTQNDRSESEIYWRTARPIAVIESRYAANSTILFVVQNKDTMPVLLSGFTVAGKERIFAKPIHLNPGESVRFSIMLEPALRQNGLCDYGGIEFALSRNWDFMQRGSRTLIINCPQDVA